MRTFIFSLLLSLFSLPASAQTLVLINDVSQSMDDKSLDTQFQAYATLLAGPLRGQLEGQQIEVVIFGNAFATVSSGTVDDAIAAFGALGNTVQRNAIIDQAFGWDPANVPKQRGGPHGSGQTAGPRSTTCVGGVLEYVHKRSVNYPKPVVVDISGDGIDNCGWMAKPGIVSQAMLADDIIVNSLPMGSNDVADWYAANVTTGFQITAWSISEFEEALYNKLMAEVAMLTEQKY